MSMHVYIYVCVYVYMQFVRIYVRSNCIDVFTGLNDQKENERIAPKDCLQTFTVLYSSRGAHC